MRPIWSPTRIGDAHQPSAQERIPRSAHMPRELGEPLGRTPRHRPERVAREVRRVLEDRELGAVVEKLAHGASVID